jgi:hypothetical protein
MTIYEGSDLQKRVERYEAAVAELRNAHQDVRDVLVDQILFERWQQLGAELGFSVQPVTKPAAGPPSRDYSDLNQQIPELNETWAS